MTHPLTIFLAEDNPGDVFLVNQALLEQGFEYRLIVAEDGLSARLLLERFGEDLPCPDLLLMDLNLPKTEGWELVRLFREHPVCATVPLIVISSSRGPKDRLWAAEAGVQHYFRKPSELEEFMKLGPIVGDLMASERKRKQTIESV